MIFRSKRRLLPWPCLGFLTAALCLWCRPAHGHTLWIEGSGLSYTVNRGETADTTNPYSPAAVTSVRALDRQGVELAVERVDEEERVLFRTPRPPTLAAVRCDWGHRVHTTRGKKFMSRRKAEAQGFKVIESFTSIQTSKTLFQDAPCVLAAVGMPFELVPVSSPFSLEPDTPLAVRLLFDGTPLEGATVFWGAGSQTRTDAEGVARIPLPRTGRHLIAARHTVPAQDCSGGVDYDQYMTFLVFQTE